MSGCAAPSCWRRPASWPGAAGEGATPPPAPDGERIATMAPSGSGSRRWSLHGGAALQRSGLSSTSGSTTVAVDRVDEHQTASEGRILGRVAEHAPRRPAAQSAPHLLGRRVTDREADGPLRRDQRLGLVDVHPPAGRDRDHAGDRQRQCRPQEALVDPRQRVAPGEPHEHAQRGDDQVQHARDAPSRVVGELVRADVAGRRSSSSGSSSRWLSCSSAHLRPPRRRGPSRRCPRSSRGGCACWRPRS